MIRPHLYVWLACFFKSFARAVDIGEPALPEELQPDEEAIRHLEREIGKLERIALGENTPFLPDDLADLSNSLAYADEVWNVDYFFSSLLETWQELMAQNIPFIDPDAAKCTAEQFRVILLRLLLAHRFLEFVEMREQLALHFPDVPPLADCVCEAMLFLIEPDELDPNFIVAAIAACDTFGIWIRETSTFQSNEFYEAVYPPEEYLIDDDDERDEDEFGVHQHSPWAERDEDEDECDDDEDIDTRRTIPCAILGEMKALLAAL